MLCARQGTLYPGFESSMLVRKYADRNGSAAVLAAKRSAGIAPEANLRNPLRAGDETRRQGDPPSFVNFGLQQKSKTGVSVAHYKGLVSSKMQVH